MQNIYLMLKTQWTAQVMSCWDTTVFMINSSQHVIYVLRGMGVNFTIRETRKAEYVASGEALKAIFWPKKWTTDLWISQFCKRELNFSICITPPQNVDQNQRRAKNLTALLYYHLWYLAITYLSFFFNNNNNKKSHIFFLLLLYLHF